MSSMGLLSNGFLLAIVAHALIGITLVWDKVLLKETPSASVVNYVFWLGALSSFGSVLAFSGMTWPGAEIIAMAMAAGALHLIGVYFYYAALNAGEASQTLALMGGFSPIATEFAAWLLLKSRLSGLATWGFAIMTAGGFLMFFSEKLSIRRMLPLVVSSAMLFGFANVMQKIAFNRTSGFVTAYVFYTAGCFLCALVFLARRKWRAEIFSASKETRPRRKISYFANRGLAGVGSLLVFLAISLTHPATVEAISGLRYVVIFVGAYLLTKFRSQWLKEQFTGWVLTAKTIGTLLVVVGLVLTGISGSDQGGAGPG